MPAADTYYVVPFKNPANDDGQHWMIWALDPHASLQNSLEGFMQSHGHLELDCAAKHKGFPHKPAAEAHIAKLREAADAANPDRIGAEQQFPDAPVRILEVGKP